MPNTETNPAAKQQEDGNTTYSFTVWMQRADQPTRSNHIDGMLNANSKDEALAKIRAGYSEEDNRRILGVDITHEQPASKVLKSVKPFGQAHNRLGLLDLDKMELETFDKRGKSCSFARGNVAEIAYKLDGDEDYSYITADSDDNEIGVLAKYLAQKAVLGNRVDELAELLMQVRDDMQGQE